MATLIHIFEKAGLGTAPFQFVDYFEKRGGSCAYCGHVITRHYGVRGVDGRTFYVGSECIYKHGDEGLVDAVKAKIREVERDKRRVKAETKAAVKRAEKMAIEAEYRARQGRIDAIIDGKRAELLPFLAEATSWLWTVLDQHRGPFCENLSGELQTEFKTICGRSWPVQKVLADIWAKSHGRYGSKKYDAACEEYDIKVRATDIIISQLSKELNATNMVARAAA